MEYTDYYRDPIDTSYSDRLLDTNPPLRDNTHLLPPPGAEHNLEAAVLSDGNIPLEWQSEGVSDFPFEEDDTRIGVPIGQVPFARNAVVKHATRHGLLLLHTLLYNKTPFDLPDNVIRAHILMWSGLGLSRAQLPAAVSQFRSLIVSRVWRRRDIALIAQSVGISALGTKTAVSTRLARFLVAPTPRADFVEQSILRNDVGRSAAAVARARFGTVVGSPT